MTAFLIGFAALVGPALAWHLHVVARRWPDDHTLPSAPVDPCRPPLALGLGADGPNLAGGGRPAIAPVVAPVAVGELVPAMREDRQP